MKTIDTFKLLLIMDEFNTLHEKRPEKLKNKFEGILQKLDLSLDDVWENIIPVELSLTMSAPEIINYSDRYRLDSIELFNSLNKNLTEEETDFFNVYINTIIGLYKLKELEEIETMFEIKDLPFIQDLILKFEDVNIISLNPTNQQLIDRLKLIEGKLKLESNTKFQLKYENKQIISNDINLNKLYDSLLTNDVITDTSKDIFKAHFETNNPNLNKIILNDEKYKQVELIYFLDSLISSLNNDIQSSHDKWFNLHFRFKTTDKFNLAASRKKELKQFFIKKFNQIIQDLGLETPKKTDY